MVTIRNVHQVCKTLFESERTDLFTKALAQHTLGHWDEYKLKQLSHTLFRQLLDVSGFSHERNVLRRYSRRH